MPADKLLVVEGDGDAAFFRRLLEDYGLDGFDIFERHKTKIPPGVDSYEHILNSINIGTKYQDIAIVVLVADCDASPTTEFNKVVRQIRSSADFPIPSKPREVVSAAGQKSVSVLMLPWDNEVGALETICYSLASRRRRTKAACVQALITCAGASNWNPQQLDKLKLRCLMATSSPHEPNIGLQYAWSTKRRRPKDLIPLKRKNKMILRIVEYLRGLP